MKKKTSELTGAALDWAVAQVTGEEIGFGNGALWLEFGTGDERYDQWRPSRDWGQGGPLIDKYQMEVMTSLATGRPEATFETLPNWEDGDTYLQAICRAVVASHFGDEIDIPDELEG